MSVKFLSAIPGPEMAAPILWTPGKCVRSAGKTMSIKFLVLGGGYFGFFGGGGKCLFYFCGREDFSELMAVNSRSWPLMGDTLVQKKAPIGAT